MHLVDAADLALLDLWRQWQGGGFGPGHLPFAGGTADQPACVMAAFGILSAAERALEPPKGSKGDRGGR